MGSIKLIAYKEILIIGVHWKSVSRKYRDLLAVLSMSILREEFVGHS